MADTLDDVLREAKTWPEAARKELQQLAADIAAELGRGDYVPTSSELTGIDRGLADAAAGRVASFADVEAVFRKHRDA